MTHPTTSGSEAGFLFTVPQLQTWRDAGGAPRFEGVAASTSLDRQSERLTPRALADMQRFSGMDLLPSHQAGALHELGVVERCWVDDGRLRIVGRLDPSNSEAMRLYQRLQAGRRYGLSVGGRVLKAHWQYDPQAHRRIRCIDSVELDHVAVCRPGAAANPDTWLGALAKAAEALGDTADDGDEAAADDTGLTLTADAEAAACLSEGPAEGQLAQRVGPETGPPPLHDASPLTDGADRFHSGHFVPSAQPAPPNDNDTEAAHRRLGLEARATRREEEGGPGGEAAVDRLGLEARATRREEETPAAQVEDAALTSLGKALLDVCRKLWPFSADPDASQTRAGSCEGDCVASAPAVCAHDAQSAGRATRPSMERGPTAEGGDRSPTEPQSEPTLDSASLAALQKQLDDLADALETLRKQTSLSPSPEAQAKERGPGGEAAVDQLGLEARATRREEEGGPDAETASPDPVVPGQPQNLPGQTSSANHPGPHRSGPDIWKGVL